MRLHIMFTRNLISTICKTLKFSLKIREIHCSLMAKSRFEYVKVKLDCSQLKTSFKSLIFSGFRDRRQTHSELLARCEDRWQRLSQIYRRTQLREAQ